MDARFMNLSWESRCISYQLLLVYFWIIWFFEAISVILDKRLPKSETISELSLFWVLDVCKAARSSLLRGSRSVESCSLIIVLIFFCLEARKSCSIPSMLLRLLAVTLVSLSWSGASSKPIYDDLVSSCVRLDSWHSFYFQTFGANLWKFPES